MQFSSDTSQSFLCEVPAYFLHKRHNMDTFINSLIFPTRHLDLIVTDVVHFSQDY